jgi:predicted transcriptional regulator
MDNHLKEALEIVKAQASVRTMTEDEITSMLQKLAKDIRNISDAVPSENVEEVCEMTAAKAIKEKSITCLECGRSFKLLSSIHLNKVHALTPAMYREKYGYQKGTPLVCKSLQRERRKKMKEMKLREKRGTSK